MARYDPADAYNMINAPDSISSAIAKSGGVNTSAGNKLAWAYRREQEKAGRIPGVQGDPQGIGRQPMSNDQLGEMTLARMAALGQTPAAAPAAPAPQQTMTRSMSERANRPVNARGVAGATFGEVNGVQKLVPQAGYYGEFQGSMAAEGLNGQMGVDRGAFEQRRSALVRQQEAGRRQTKQEAKDAGDLAFERQKELQGIKSYRGGTGGKSGDTVTEREQKAGIGTYNKAVNEWRHNKDAGNTLAAQVASARLAGRTTIKMSNGQEYDLDEADAIADDWTTRPRPQAQDFYTLSTPAPKPAAAPKGPGFLQRVGNALGMGGGQAPASSPPSARPASGGTADIDAGIQAVTRNGKRFDFDRAIADAEADGLMDDVAHLRKRKAESMNQAAR